MIIMLMYKLICVVFKTFNQDISVFCCKTCDLNLKGMEYYEFVCF